MSVCAIDPGLSGAIARLGSGLALTVFDMPTLDGQVDGYALCDLLLDLGQVDGIWVETASTRPQQSAQSGLTTGVNYGIVLGVIMAIGRPLHHVTPAKWVADLRLPRSGKTPAEKKRAKEARVLRACETWPAQAAGFRGPRGGALDGRADAALIALWASVALREAVA